MDAKLLDLIENARRELRRASGVPLTPEEIELERRKKQLGEFENFIYRAFSAGQMWLLGMQTRWHEDTPIVHFEVEKRVFRLLPSGEDFELVAVNPDGELPILHLKRNEPLFAVRVVVAIAEALQV